MITDEQIRNAFNRFATRATLANAGVTNETEAQWGKYNGSTWDTSVGYSTGFYWVTIDTGAGVSHMQVTNPLGFSLSGGDLIYIARSSNQGRWIVTKTRATEGP